MESNFNGEDYEEIIMISDNMGFDLVSQSSML